MLSSSSLVVMASDLVVDVFGMVFCRKVEGDGYCCCEVARFGLWEGE